LTEAKYGKAVVSDTILLVEFSVYIATPSPHPPKREFAGWIDLGRIAWILEGDGCIRKHGQTFVAPLCNRGGEQVWLRSLRGTLGRASKKRPDK
jgi:hypothetical protein